jgi:hypothetical protein
MVHRNRSSDDENHKTLMLAAVTALSPGVSNATAQGEIPSAAEGSYFSGRHQAAQQTTNDRSGEVQSGSSELARQYIGLMFGRTIWLGTGVATFLVQTSSGGLGAKRPQGNTSLCAPLGALRISLL